MNVLLISANTLTRPYPVYPLGLDYVAGAISPPHNVTIADMNVMGDGASLGKFIQGLGPDVIGLSIRNIDNTDTQAPQGYGDQYRELTEIIRMNSEAPLVLGGSGFTLFPKELMQTLKADYGIIGEGERLSFLLEALENNTDLSDIPGLVIGSSIQNAAQSRTTAFNRHFDADAPHLKFYLDRGRMLNLQTQRGCCFECIYCTYPHVEGRRLRPTPPDQAAETALRLQAAGAKYLFITDSAFNADYPHSIEVARAFQKARVSIPWGGFFAPTSPPENYYDILADAGLTHVEFGTESLSDQVLAAYGKPFRARHVFVSHEAARKAGINIAHYFLLGGPGETRESLENTLECIDRLSKSVLFFFCGMRIYPCTRLYDIALREGRITQSQNLLEPVFYESASVGKDEIIRMVTKKAAGRPNWIFGAGGDETARKLSKMYELGFSGPLWEFLIR
jgi:radical SAM superfamily enzyme YgiQ (UPF0313 family)